NATITVNGTAVTSGNASGAIALNVGSNTITTVVTAQDGTTTKTYTVTVNRANIPAPVISFFTPIQGAIGTTVTIQGSNFHSSPGSNVVFFGATRATVTSA